MGLYSSLLYVPGMLIIGGVTDKINRKYLILFSGIIGGVLCALNFFANTLEILIVLKIFHGLFHALSQPATFSIISDLFPKERHTYVFFLY